VIEFTKNIYRKIYANLDKPWAMWILVVLSILESCILPISPLVLLIPMSLANTKKSWYFSFVATIGAVIGSIIGYIMGYYLISVIMPYIIKFGYLSEFTKVEHWFQEWGLLVLLPASILPFPPFKVFTIAAGLTKIKFFPFVIAAALVRWLHFALIPASIAFGKKKFLVKYEDNLLNKS
tara:strand:+ start:16994 stop:17530 length:537 start_codon:yes stop_codon:yes gene_type:complete